jgi:hypothetical protein
MKERFHRDWFRTSELRLLIIIVRLKQTYYCLN